MSAVIVGLAEAVLDIVNTNKGWQIHYTFKGLAVKMSRVNLMHKKRSSTAHDLV